MSTITTWSANPADVGPMYPFVGTEWIFLVICVAGWLIWQVWQIKSENATYEEDSKKLQGEALTDAINHVWCNHRSGK
jgi:ABC-type nickel/cobalt efflux system permease component RcnA